MIEKKYCMQCVSGGIRDRLEEIASMFPCNKFIFKLDKDGSVLFTNRDEAESYILNEDYYYDTFRDVCGILKGKSLIFNGYSWCLNGVGYVMYYEMLPEDEVHVYYGPDFRVARDTFGLLNTGIHSKLIELHRVLCPESKFYSIVDNYSSLSIYVSSNSEIDTNSLSSEAMELLDDILDGIPESLPIHRVDVYHTGISSYKVMACDTSKEFSAVITY